VGGESGFGARPMKRDWVVSIRQQCQTAKIPFFFKQWGGVQKSKNGRTLEGWTWEEMPANSALAIPSNISAAMKGHCSLPSR
jgi:protein gp37